MPGVSFAFASIATPFYAREVTGEDPIRPSASASAVRAREFADDSRACGLSIPVSRSLDPLASCDENPLYVMETSPGWWSVRGAVACTTCGTPQLHRRC